MSEQVQVTVGKTPDGMYVMHEYALTTLIKQAQDAIDQRVALNERIDRLRRLVKSCENDCVDMVPIGVIADIAYGAEM